MEAMRFTMSKRAEAGLSAAGLVVGALSCQARLSTPTQFRIPGLKVKIEKEKKRKEKKK